MQQIGKYQLVRKLATGGMAEVFLAKAAGPMGFEKTLVLKRILPHLAEEPTFVEMFLSEAKLAAQLTHPNIVQIFDFGEADGAYFLAMEYIDGPNLRTLGKRATAQGLALPPALCARLIASACEGLAFAHDFADPDTGEALGLIHRDISPDNILLSKQGAVKVVDFGIAKAAGQSHRTQSGIIKGKLAYMPPEQVRAKPLDRRVDVYALGVVLYELLTGHKPFESTTDVGLMQAILFEPLVPAVQHRPELPEALQQILDKALAKDREQRYADCPAFQSDLEDFILSAGRPVTTHQLAQLIAQVSTGGDLPMPTPHGTPRSGPKQATPVHTPAPRTGPGIHADSGSMQAPPSEPMQTPGDVVPTEASEPRTAPYIPPAQRAAQDAPALAATREQAAPVPPQRRNRLVPALVGGALLLAGGGFVLWRTAATPPPAPAVVAAVTPAAPPPSTPPADEPAVAAPTETPPAAPEPKAEAAPSPAPTEPASPPPASPAPEPAPAPVVAAAPAKPTVKRPPAPPKPVGKGTLEFRIRPYATVFVNGKKEGDTPMPPLELPAGRYVLKLVNKDLSKTVNRTVEVKAGQPTVLKVNLLEE